ncbi:unnamed protein product [Protopolystoma xenopodis]|uniref:Uncharacterized protein n=1 Tax=Protopolystoma xenopodis TaxID=117903 RepID=A0A448WUT5_9PLAT|nr:unnamed protein product [Protopolystoma xenopodis]
MVNIQFNRSGVSACDIDSEANSTFVSQAPASSHNPAILASSIVESIADTSRMSCSSSNVGMISSGGLRTRSSGITGNNEGCGSSSRLAPSARLDDGLEAMDADAEEEDEDSHVNMGQSLMDDVEAELNGLHCSDNNEIEDDKNPVNDSTFDEVTESSSAVNSVCGRRYRSSSRPNAPASSRFSATSRIGAGGASHLVHRRDSSSSRRRPADSSASRLGSSFGTNDSPGQSIGCGSDSLSKSTALRIAQSIRSGAIPPPPTEPPPSTPRSNSVVSELASGVCEAGFLSGNSVSSAFSAVQRGQHNSFFNIPLAPGSAASYLPQSSSTLGNGRNGLGLSSPLSQAYLAGSKYMINQGIVIQQFVGYLDLLFQ